MEINNGVGEKAVKGLYASQMIDEVSEGKKAAAEARKDIRETKFSIAKEEQKKEDKEKNTFKTKLNNEEVQQDAGLAKEDPITPTKKPFGLFS